MPELPEVETIKRVLTGHLPGRCIERVLVRDSRLRWPVDESKLQRLVVGHQIHGIDRRAKYLLFHLSNENTLILHLGMSGRLLMIRDLEPWHKHDHVIFYFDDQTELRFRDPRRFGLVDAVSKGALKTYPRFIKLGFEPLAPGVSSEKLFAKVRNLKRPIKNLLMDANFIVGIGNIYANEALFQAGIHPATPSNQISQSDWQKLLHEIQDVLKRAIKHGGTTLNDFVNSNGEIGYFQLSLSVYGKEGENCPRCQTKIERFVQVGRSTYFCPGCQRRIAYS
ncbi:MAG: bifunctional DNA-formamidopyrimidine glycosylase/DNA-(apurinic or apyrimidinic site) lyase [bacterium]